MEKQERDFAKMILQALFVVLILLWAAGRFACIYMGNYISICLFDVALFAFVGAAVAFRKIEFPRQAPFTLPLLLFTGIAIASWVLSIRIFSLHQILPGGLYLARWTAFALLPFVVIRLSKEKGAGFFENSLLLMCGIVAVAGFILTALHPESFIRAWGIPIDTTAELASTFMDANFAGMFYALGAISILSRTNTPLPIWRWGIFSLFFYAFLLTYSKSAHVAYVIGLLVLAFSDKSARFRVVAIGSLIVLSMGWYGHYQNPSPKEVQKDVQMSVKTRETMWQQGFALISKHPWLGVGYNNYRHALKKYGLEIDVFRVHWFNKSGNDSSLLFVWSTTGIFGLITYLWLLISLFQIPLNNHFALSLRASLGGLLFHSLFIHSLFYPPILGWLMVLAGAASATKAKTPG